MPPRHGKSTLISEHFPPWYLGTYPDREVIVAGYEASFASRWGMRSRDLLEEWGPQLWPGVTVRKDRHAASDWRIAGHRGGMRTAGVGTGVMGLGGHLIIIDDPVKDGQQAASRVRRDATWEWYLSTLYTRQEPGAAIILVMTRWHLDDLAGRILKEMDSGGEHWEILSLPAIAIEGQEDPLGRRPGQALWPARYGVIELMKYRRALTEYWWSSLYQQNPVPEWGDIIKRDWWNFWKPADRPDLGPVRMPKGGTRPCIQLPACSRFASSWDLTFKGGENMSYVVGQEWGRHKQDVFLLDQFRAHMDFPQTVKAYVAFHEERPRIRAKWIEDKANAPALVAICKKRIPGIKPVNIPGDKEDRCRNAAPYVESGNVYLPHPEVAPWVEGFIEELTAFPSSPNDDQVDAFSQAIHMLYSDSKPSVIWGS